MSDLQNRLQRFLDRHQGLLPLKPCLVGRGYKGGGRLAGRGPGLVRRRDGKYLVERWIASSTRAGWGAPNTREGLSELAGFRPSVPLCDALRALPDVLLGPARAAAHLGEFRVLTKILDPYEPIGFHFHHKDEAVRAEPALFAGERFGKDEAYYFLPGPKGNWPYTHVGIHPDVTLPQLTAALAAGRDALLEISPYFFQVAGRGFFVPAGLVHSPGTALTLEIQQPSDVGAGFGLRVPEDSADRQAAIEQEAAKVCSHLDLPLCQQRDLLQRFAIEPRPLDGAAPGLQAWWIVSPEVTPKFSAQRILAHRACAYRPKDCLALLVWSGQGTINGQPVRPGTEFFVSHRAASDGLRIEPADRPLELFAIFAARCDAT